MGDADRKRFRRLFGGLHSRPLQLSLCSTHACVELNRTTVVLL